MQILLGQRGQFPQSVKALWRQEGAEGVARSWLKAGKTAEWWGRCKEASEVEKQAGSDLTAS